MAYLAVNPDKSEFIFPAKPVRNTTYSDNSKHYWSCLHGFSFSPLQYETGIRLPVGFIENIIGQQLTWKDEPIKI